MQQGIAHCEIELKGGGVAEFFDIAAGLERGNEEAEAGYADGEGIEVDAVNGIEGILGEDAGVGPRFFLQPEGEESLERAEEKVTGAAGGIDEADFPEAEGLDGGSEGAVENELLDKVRSLEEGVALLGFYGEVLIEIAQETGAPFGIGEVVVQLASLLIARPPEEDELVAEISAGTELPERIVLLIQEVPEAGEGSEFFKIIFEVIAISRVVIFFLTKVEDLLVIGLLPTFPRTRQAGRLDEFLIFQKAREDTGQNPSDGNLGALAGEPFAEGEGGALAVFCFAVALVEVTLKFRGLFASGEEVVLDTLDPGFE